MRNIMLTTIIMLASLPLSAQTTADSTARNKLDNLVLRSVAIETLFPEERVYLHFDNTAYYLTETIWFKAYVMSGSENTPTTMSRVLYVELVAPEGYVVETKKYKIEENGCCNGEFELSPLLLSGYYEIRAYTRYMLNRGKEAIFSRVFPIFDKVNADNWEFKNLLDRRRGFLIGENKKSKNNDVEENIEWVNSNVPKNNVIFYPEGGHLVDGIESRVAFEVFAADGINSNRSITILADGKEVLKATPTHFGKGSFTFTPYKGVKYSAELQDGKKSISFNLPEVMDEGAILKLDESNDYIHVNIDNNLQQESELGCAILHRGKILFYERYNANKRNMLFAIDKNTLKEGVNRAVLFIDDSIPLAERLFFVTHEKPQDGDNSRVRLTVKSNGYTPRNLSLQPHEKIKLTIGREDGKPLDGGNYSISVSDSSYRQTTSYDYNIYTYMLLGSELKGYIPEASRYFDPANRERNKELDLIMLTHGWSSYDWHRLTTQSFKLDEPIERGIVIKGSLVKKSSSQKLGRMNHWNISAGPKTMVNLLIPYSDTVATRYSFLTDYNGEFRVTTNDFTGKKVAKLVPNINNISLRDSIFAFALDRYFSPEMRLFHYWERNTGKQITYEQLQKKKIDVIKVNPFNYLLSPVEVVPHNKQERNYRPPRSEIRLDFLDEWEYAQDVTYMREKFNSETSDGYNDNHSYSIHEHNIAVAPINGHQYYIEGSSELSSFDRSVMSGGHINDRNTGTGTAVYFEISNQDPRFAGLLTASDVLRSAFWRHNLNWCYWIQSIVVNGSYSSYETPTVNYEYLKGIEPEKMMNFKEIIIRSDENTRKQFGKGKRIRGLGSKRKLAYDYSNYYKSFLGIMGIIPKNGEIEDAPDPVILNNDIQAIRSSNITRYSRPVNSFTSDHSRATTLSNGILTSDAIPNYVACFIPYSDEEKSTQMLPNLTSKGTTRYTMLYGYNESKRFYSPDYSTMRLDSSTSDYRRTLLWVPDIEAKDGSIEVELYNSSSGKGITVDIEGYSNGTFYGNGIAQTIEAPEKRATEEYVIPSVGITTPRVLAHCFKITERGREYYTQGEYDKAFSAFSEAAGLGYGDAMYNCAVCFMEGNGTEQDFTEGFRYFRKAANMGNKKSLHNLASCYLLGIGTAKNDTLGVKWYLESAKEGFEMSQTAVAGCYLKGIGIEQDSAKAHYWYKKAADKEEPIALYFIGNQMAKSDSALHLSKRKLRQQPAIEYIKKAAEKNNTKAQHQLAQYYESGYYVKKSKKKAFYWYLRAANEGHTDVYEKVAQCYEKGYGVKNSDFEAAKWYRLAEEQGSQTAKEKMIWYNTFHFFGKH